jgi:hypothetical protein
VDEQTTAAGGSWFLEHWQAVLQHPLVVSALGSCLAVWHAFPGATWGSKAVVGASSFILGIYGGPALNSWWGIQSRHVEALVILGCATGGLIFCNAFLEYLRATRFADLPMIRNMLGRAQEKR